MRTTLPPFVAIVIASITLLTACSAVQAADGTQARNMAIVRQSHASLAAGDLDAFKAVIGPSYVRHCQAMPPEFQELHGTGQFFAFLEDFVTAAPGYVDTISNMIAQGDKVAYVSTMKGVQSAPMGELPASGKPFTLTNIIIQRLKDGKIVETWVSWDNVAFLTQLGFMP